MPQFILLDYTFYVKLINTTQDKNLGLNWYFLTFTSFISFIGLPPGWFLTFRVCLCAQDRE